ncbi:hypothetical protein PG994_000181 [Apiospora phragmitis]|uniref:Uncharacterized protein n=1 Tax=Apiospora phragmitis TaxID=2905665 RepID=A0ABR1X5K6_9PEZI
MEFQTQAPLPPFRSPTQAPAQGTSLLPLRPPPPSFDKQRIYDAMNENERNGFHTISQSQTGDSRFNMLVLVSGVVSRLEEEKPDQLYAPDSPQPTRASTAGHRSIAHGPASSPQQTPQHRESRETSSTISPSPRANGGRNRAPLPGHSRGGNSERSQMPASPSLAAAPLPSIETASTASPPPRVRRRNNRTAQSSLACGGNASRSRTSGSPSGAAAVPTTSTEDAPQTTQSRAARAARSQQHRSIRTTKSERNTTDNETRLALEIETYGHKSPNGPCDSAEPVAMTV